jgi:hypothetical protein
MSDPVSSHEIQPTTCARRRKIFGIGWAKTGTTTLGRCFEILGYNHQGQNLSLVPQIMHGDFSKTLRIAAAKESFEDWPWILIFRELDQAFPGSRFILTTRDPERWLASYRAMLSAQGPCDAYLSEIRSHLYGFEVASATDQALVERFNRHNEEVREYFKTRTADLLVVDWERGDAWDKICAFLNESIPPVAFPHLNRRA